jgi:hypothetical protein
MLTAAQINTPMDGETIRSKCQRARVTYSPRFSWQPPEHVHSMPWAAYRDGTAVRCFSTVGAAVEWFRSQGFRFDF